MPGMELNLQLDVVLEALVIRHSAAAAAGSLWVCLAVLAAAFVLWRIRSAAVDSKPDDSRGHGPDQTQLQSPSPQPEARKETSPPEARSPIHVAAGEEAPCMSFKEKGTLFEVRCCCEDEEGCDSWEGAIEGGDHEQEEEQQQKPRAVGGVVGHGVWWGERWRGDLGWYLQRDVPALNGRVVRLWEDEKKLTRRRRQLVAW